MQLWREVTLPVKLSTGPASTVTVATKLWRTLEISLELTMSEEVVTLLKEQVDFLILQHKQVCPQFDFSEAGFVKHLVLSRRHHRQRSKTKVNN